MDQSDSSVIVFLVGNKKDMEEKREVSGQLLKSYLPEFKSTLPALINHSNSSKDFSNKS